MSTLPASLQALEGQAYDLSRIAARVDALEKQLPTKANVGGGGGGGVTDHGALTGLTDDDHPQYHNNARGDARYYTRAQVDTALGNNATNDRDRANHTGTQTASTVSDFSTSADARVQAAQGSATPLVDGTAAAGSGTTWAPIDHIHPTDTSRAPTANPTFTGTIVIPAAAGSTSPYRKSEVDTLLTAKQDADADLATIAGLTATTDNFMQAKAGAWASRTVRQVRDDLFLSVSPRADLKFGVKCRQNFDVENGGVNTSAAMTNLIQATPVILEAGDIVHAVTVQGGGTGWTTPTHQWIALYDAAGTSMLRQSTDQTTTAWGASVARRFVMTSDYTITTSGIYYVALHTGCTTGGTLLGGTAGPTWNNMKTNIYTNMANMGRTGALATTATAPATLSAASTNSFTMWCLVELT